MNAQFMIALRPNKCHNETFIFLNLRDGEENIIQQKSDKTFSFGSQKIILSSDKPAQIFKNVTENLKLPHCDDFFFF